MPFAIVQNYDDFAGFLREKRVRSGLSQATVDGVSNNQPGYTGKLEIGMKKAIVIHPSAGNWLGALGCHLAVVDAATLARLQMAGEARIRSGGTRA